MKFSKLLALGLALFLLLSGFAGCGTGDDKTTEFFDMTGGGPWTVGFGQVELTIPETEEPLYIAGYRNGYEITGVLDPLYATAVWLDCGGDGVLLIGIDCIGLSNKYVEDIRTDLAAECAVWGCAAVNLYATHTHAGIDTLGLWGPVAVDGKNDDFQEVVVAAAADAARLAYENRRPGTLTYAKADTGDIQRDSRDPQVYDPYLHQLRFRPDDGEGGVRMVSYAAHAESLRSENTWVSRDFPGVMAEILKEQTGDDLLFLPAAIGGLIMTRDLRGECGFSSVEDSMVAAGRRLADCLLAIPEADERPVEPVLTSARVTFTV
ncbi:MAG: hypothetical protein ACI4V1_01055, partial [Eubacteriales bacterium]